MSENFFWKVRSQDFKFSRQISIFFDGTGLKRKILFLHRYAIKRIFRFLSFNIFFRGSKSKIGKFDFDPRKKTLKLKNRKIRFKAYVRKNNIFRLRPVPSKNIEIWRLNQKSRERTFQKMFSGVFGDSPKTIKVGKI